LNFLDVFSKNPLTSNLIEIHPVGAELFHADGQTDGRTDTKKLVVTLSQFCGGA